MTKYICWTDTANRRHMATDDQVVIVVPGIDGDTASVFVNSYNTGISTTKSSTSPGSIFMMPTIFEALRFIKTGSKTGAVYGAET